MPEDKLAKTVVKKTLLGLMSEVPGGGTIAAVIQATADAASRQRDEDWWAMVAARVTSLESSLQERIAFDDPEFVAAAHRIIRAAQETADDEKRDRLAAALAHAGSWSDLAPDDRARMERLVAEISTREIGLLKILGDPRAWMAENHPTLEFSSLFAGSVVEMFLDPFVAGDDLNAKAAVRSALESLERRGLVSVPQGMMSGTAILDGRATGLGWELIHYLSGIGA